MPTIQHMAILCRDAARLAKFYVDAFGMRIVDNSTSVFYLSDGSINLALIPSTRSTPGLNHLGFQVDSIQDIKRRLQAAGASGDVEERPRDGRYAEFRVHDPEGNPIDLAEGGWKLQP